MTNAQTFYGSAYKADKHDAFAKATKYLDMAIKAEGDSKKQEMALSAAIKAENEALN